MQLIGKTLKYFFSCFKGSFLIVVHPMLFIIHISDSETAPYIEDTHFIRSQKSHAHKIKIPYAFQHLSL